MYGDLREGGSVEADQIVGDLLARGPKAGINMPLLSDAYSHICAALSTECGPWRG
jgi:ketopantoate reductase